MLLSVHDRYLPVIDSLTTLILAFTEVLNGLWLFVSLLILWLVQLYHNEMCRTPDLAAHNSILRLLGLYLVPGLLVQRTIYYYAFLLSVLSLRNIMCIYEKIRQDTVNEAQSTITFL